MKENGGRVKIKAMEHIEKKSSCQESGPRNNLGHIII